MADIRSAAAEIRRGKKRRRTNYSMKIFHRATIKRLGKIVRRLSQCAKTISLVEENKQRETARHLNNYQNQTKFFFK